MEQPSTPTADPHVYRSYLVRLWREDQDAETWRASLQCAASDERLGFASLDDLFSYIRGQAESVPGLHSDVGEKATDEGR